MLCEDFPASEGWNDISQDNPLPWWSLVACNLWSWAIHSQLPQADFSGRDSAELVSKVSASASTLLCTIDISKFIGVTQNQRISMHQDLEDNPIRRPNFLLNVSILVYFGRNLEYVLTLLWVTMCHGKFVCSPIVQQPFTVFFPQANIHELMSSDLLHQVIKGTFKDHIVFWVNYYLVIQHGENKAKEIIDDIDCRYKWLQWLL